MSLAHLALSLALTALTPRADPPLLNTSTPRAEPPPSPSVAGAILLDDGEPAAAAGVFETLWLRERDPAALAYAGLSRARAGHAAHAVAYLTEALAGGLPPHLAEAARAGLAEARRHVRLVAIHLHLQGDGPLQLAWTRPGHATPTLRIQISPPPGAHIVPVALDPGPWLVEVRRGAWSVAHTLTVTPDLRELTVTEPATPTKSAPNPRLRPLRLAGLISGGGTAVLGAALLAAGQARIQSDLEFLTDPSKCSFTTGCSRRLDGATWRAAGAGLLGAGLGITTSALGTLLKTSRARRIAWSIDLAVGGALLGSSFFGGLAGAAFNRASAHPRTTGELLEPLARHTSAAALLGLGLGLASSATLALVLDRPNARRTRLRAHLSPTGLTLVGQF